jgi:hypothetical protein
MTGTSRSTITSWPPRADEFYLADRSGRLFFQGDIFDDVPLVKGTAGGDPPRTDPAPSYARKSVALLRYGCDIYRHDNHELFKIQPVAIVRSGRRDNISPDWKGGYGVCPLPNLRGDGEMWLVDFSVISNIDRRYLVEDNRIAALSEPGWTAFRQRLILAATRITVRPEKILDDGRALWSEVGLLQAATQAGIAADAFRGWYEAPNATLADRSPRWAAERHLVDDLDRAFEAFVESPPPPSLQSESLF